MKPLDRSPLAADEHPLDVLTPSITEAQVARDERFSREEERRERIAAANRPAPPPPPAKLPRKIRLKRGCMVGGELRPAGTVLVVLAEPIWPPGTVREIDARQLLGTGRAEAVTENNKQ